MTSFAEVQALFRMRKAPAGLIAHLVDYEEYYTIRLYRENFDKLTKLDRFLTANWLEKTLEAIRVVVPCYLEVWKAPGVPGE